MTDWGGRPVDPVVGLCASSGPVVWASGSEGTPTVELALRSRNLGRRAFNGQREGIGDLKQLPVGNHERRPQQDGVAVRAVGVARTVI